ncbi:transporter [Arthrobacter sp. JZ12]|uniref:transporter n=1 Tax=Arthrobacter sp. JZ12 TaxID=2654190 RepID=UPI002B470445|nr:transporter [Arthrobacter sp. JZ12]WRH25235.1 transporter [Arthrobacter sp. JZ12]
MVAHLLRLKLTLLRNSLRRSTWQLVGVVLGGLYGLGVLGTIIAGLVALGFAEFELVRTIVILGGSAAVLGWLVIPLVASGVDMTLDPARFVTYAVPMRQLMAGLALGGVIGIPGIATLLAFLALAITWIRYPAAAVAALICAVCAVLLCVVGSRLITTAGASLASSRRFKDVSSLIAIVPLVLLGPIFAGIVNGFRDSPDYAHTLAAVLGWTPLGVFLAIPADLAAGAPLQALARFGIGIATIAVLALLWQKSLSHALVTPPFNSVSRKGAGNLGLFGRLPATPTGAVAARALTYWIRDPRYAASIIVVPLLPVLFWFVGGEAGNFALLNYVGPIIAFMLAWSISADISYDNTAFWMHLSTGVRGRDDRLGRAAALLLFATPVVLIATVVPLLLTNSAADLPMMLGLGIGALLTGTGLSSVTSARYTYNVPLPGESPFKTPPGTGFSMLVIQLLGWVVQFALLLPEIALAVAYLVTGNAAFGWATLAAGAVLGAAAFIGGVRIGGAWYDKRAPELLQAVSVNK